MPQPTPYVPSFSFTDFQASNPLAPLPGYAVDAETAALEETLGGVLTNLALIQRDDGKLKDGVVTVDAVDPALRTAIADQVSGDAISAAAANATAAAADAAAAETAAGDAADSAAAAAASAATAQAIATGDLTIASISDLPAELAGIHTDIDAKMDASVPRKLSYGSRVPVRTMRLADAAADAIHTQLVGAAAAAGTTGGYGKTRYRVSDPSPDPSEEESWGWALAQARANGGGLIQFDTRGKFDVILDADVRLDFDNVTIIAPGRNVTFWGKSLESGFVLQTVNCVIAYCVFRTLPGRISVDDGTSTKDEHKLVSIIPEDCDKVGFIGCEFRHASDGALDMSSTTFIGTSSPCHVTVQDCIWWDTDQASLMGSNDPTADLTSPVLLTVTLYHCIFAYCGERQPKVLGRTFADIVECYTLTAPFQRDNLAPTAEFSICYGAGVLYGGRLRVRGCLWAATDGVGGYNATWVVDGGVGAIDAQDCAAEDAMVINTANVANVPAAGYVLAHAAVPAAGAARDTWVSDRWAAAGGRRDAAPDGLFIHTADTAAYPNGETVLCDRALGGRWIRVDAPDEYASLADSQATDAILTLPRGSNIVIAADALTVDPNTSYFTVAPEAGNTDNLSTINGGVDGRVIVMRAASAAYTITLATGGNIDLPAPIPFTRNKPVALIWDTGTAKWQVIAGLIPVLASGRYSPPLTASLNCNTLSVNGAMYTRNGNIVTVSFDISGIAPAVATTELLIDLPIASNLLANGDLCGSCCTFSLTPEPGSVVAEFTVDKAKVKFNAAAASAFRLVGSFQYEVK